MGAPALANVSNHFVIDLASMSRDELVCRILNQAGTIAAYERCLDGLSLYGMDGHRRPEDIRNIVTNLLK